METDDWERLKNPKFLERLASCINYDRIKESLTEIGILTTSSAEDIWEKETLDGRNRCLLQCLQKGKPETYDLFVFVLHINGMHRAVLLLRAQADDLPRLLMDPQWPASPSGSQLELHSSGNGSANNTADCAHSDAHWTVGEASSAEQQVVKATRWMHGDNVYPMVHWPRGKCIIVNNRDFEGNLTRRCGSDVDVYRMECLFSALHFECVVHRNLTAAEMLEVLKAAAESMEQRAADCLVVILMSHGNRDVIYGTDGNPVHRDNEVYPLFNNENCPALQGKPKLFFVQACLGGETDNGTYVRSTVADTLPLLLCPLPEARTSGAVQQRRVAFFSDMYIVYATMPGFVALRNEVTGSWLLSAVYNVFSQHAGSMHLEDMMRLVHGEMLKAGTHDGTKVTPSTKLCGWTRWLYFNPGLCAEERLPREAAVPSHTS